MKNEMNEIPTPETDAAIKTVGLYRGDEMEIVDPEFARDLERRLTEVKRLERERNETANIFMAQVKKLQAQLAIAREALQAAVAAKLIPTNSASEGGPMRNSIQVQVADQVRSTLKQTAPKP